VHCSLDAIPNMQLSEHLVDVFVDRVSRNVEAVGDLSVGQSLSEVAKDFFLPWRQFGQIGFRR